MIQYKDKISPLLKIDSQVNSPMNILSWNNTEITTDTVIRDKTQANITKLSYEGEHCMLCNKTLLTPLVRHLILDHKLIKLYTDTLQGDKCPNIGCDMKNQKYLENMNYL